jgi:hypothetical protein
MLYPAVKALSQYNFPRPHKCVSTVEENFKILCVLTTEIGEKSKNIGECTREIESNVLGPIFMALLTKYFVLTEHLLQSLF